MWEPPIEHPLRRMFAGVTEHAFLSTLGVADPSLVDYLSGLLSRFIHVDAVYRLRNNQGQRMTELLEMMVEAESLPEGGSTRREYHKHIGDFALFWTGLYPESLDRMQSLRSKDHVINFTCMGKRSYLIASTYDDEQWHDEASLFRRLSDEFELCAHGLREARREWEETAQHRQLPGSLIQ